MDLTFEEKQKVGVLEIKDTTCNETKNLLQQDKLNHGWDVLAVKKYKSL